MTKPATITPSDLDLLLEQIDDANRKLALLSKNVRKLKERFALTIPTTGKDDDQKRREWEADEIIKKMRKSRATHAEIETALAAKGLEWPR